MAAITFDDMWEELKAEGEEERQFFQTAEEISKVINRLSEERIRKGLTQRELSKRCGLKQSALARMESLKSIPRLDTVLKVAEALNLEMHFAEVPEITSIVYVDTGSAVFQSRKSQDNRYQYSGFNNYPLAMAQ